jgi:hypothetical protein
MVDVDDVLEQTFEGAPCLEEAKERGVYFV